jgi:hypothetical protein
MAAYCGSIHICIFFTTYLYYMVAYFCSTHKHILNCIRVLHGCILLQYTYADFALYTGNFGCVLLPYTYAHIELHICTIWLHIFAVHMNVLHCIRVLYGCVLLQYTYEHFALHTCTAWLQLWQYTYANFWLHTCTTIYICILFCTTHMNNLHCIRVLYGCILLRYSYAHFVHAYWYCMAAYCCSSHMHILHCILVLHGCILLHYSYAHFALHTCTAWLQLWQYTYANFSLHTCTTVYGCILFCSTHMNILHCILLLYGCILWQYTYTHFALHTCTVWLDIVEVYKCIHTAMHKKKNRS